MAVLRHEPGFSKLRGRAEACSSGTRSRLASWGKTATRPWADSLLPALCLSEGSPDSLAVAAQGWCFCLVLEPLQPRLNQNSGFLEFCVRIAEEG